MGIAMKFKTYRKKLSEIGIYCELAKKEITICNSSKRPLLSFDAVERELNKIQLYELNFHYLELNELIEMLNLTKMFVLTHVEGRKLPETKYWLRISKNTFLNFWKEEGWGTVTSRDDAYQYTQRDLDSFLEQGLISSSSLINELKEEVK